jgi:hypothetical protein
MTGRGALGGRGSVGGRGGPGGGAMHPPSLEEGPTYDNYPQKGPENKNQQMKAKGASKKDVEQPNHLDWLKRFHGAYDIILIMFNIISAFTTLAGSSELFNFDADSFNDGKHTNEAILGVFIDDVGNYKYKTKTCTDNDIVRVSAQCAYKTRSEYIAYVLLWAVLLSTLFIAKVHDSMPYKTNDLRFYLAYDRFATSNLNKMVVYIGLFLSFASFVTLVYFLVQSSEPVEGAFVYIAVNVYLLRRSLYSRWKVFNSPLHPDEEEPALYDVFPVPIPLHPLQSSWRNGYGFFYSQEDLYAESMRALQMADMQKNDIYLARYGDPEQLREALVILDELDENEA